MVWTVSLVKSFHAREENLLPSRVPHLSRSFRAYFRLPEKCNKNFACSRSKLGLISLHWDPIKIAVHSLSQYSRPWITILFNLFSLFASESTESKCALRPETPSGSITYVSSSLLCIVAASCIHWLYIFLQKYQRIFFFFASFLRSLLKKNTRFIWCILRSLYLAFPHHKRKTMR